MKRLLIAIAFLALPTLASAQQPETVEYYGTDLIGSIRIVYDGSGNVIGRQDYTPFGTPVLNGTSMPKEGFGGNEKDDETQKMYFYARTLSSRTGRFGRTDPIYSAFFEPQGWNRYSYALNSPVSRIDPNGEDSYHTFGYANGGGSTDCKTFKVGDYTVDCFGGSVGFAPPAVGGGGEGRGGGGFQAHPKPKPGPQPKPDPNTDPKSDPDPRGGNRDDLPKEARSCEILIQNTIDSTLDTHSIYLGPTSGRDVDPNGKRNGAYNFNYFLPNGGTNPIPAVFQGRIPGSRLHLPLPGGEDPTIFGPGQYDGQLGWLVTGHMDSANPADDLLSFGKHVVKDVILKSDHGC